MDAVLERTEVDPEEAKRINEAVEALDLTDKEGLKTWMGENIKWFPSDYEYLEHEDGILFSRDEKLDKLYKEQVEIIDQNTVPEELKQKTDDLDEPKKEYLISDYEGHIKYNLKAWATPKPEE